MSVRPVGIVLFCSALFVISLLVLSSFPAASASAGISLPPKEKRTFIFTPGMVYEGNWHVNGAERLESYLGGDLAPYATLDDPAQNTSSRTLHFRLVLPDELPPGEHALYVGVVESRPDSAVGGRAAAQGGIWVVSLYPGPFVKASLGVVDVAEGSPANATLRLESYSQVEMREVHARLAVYNSTNDLVVEGGTRRINLPSREKTTLSTLLATEDLPAGEYRVVGQILNVQPNLTVEARFRVGTFTLWLKSHSTELVAGKINPFSFMVLSNWNGPIVDVYGDVRLLDAAGTSPTGSFVPFGKLPLTAYLDLTAVDPDGIPAEGMPATGTIAVHYRSPDGVVSSVEFPINVTVMPYGPDELSEKPPVEEAGSMFDSLVILYLALAFLVLLNLFLLFRPRRRKEREDGSG